MTNHLVRLYTAAAAILVFFLLWATIAAHPWATTEQVTPQDPRLMALARREKTLRKRAAVVNRIVGRRWAVYERRSTRRQWQNTVVLQRHLQQLEASQAAAIRAAQAANGQTAQARAYAASVVAWANQQLQAAGSTTTVASTVASAGGTRPAGVAPAAPGAPKEPAAAALASEPASAATAVAAAPAAAPAPVAAPAPIAAPVQVVALPPVTTTQVSKKK